MNVKIKNMNKKTHRENYYKLIKNLLILINTFNYKKY